MCFVFVFLVFEIVKVKRFLLCLEVKWGYLLISFLFLYYFVVKVLLFIMWYVNFVMLFFFMLWLCNISVMFGGSLGGLEDLVLILFLVLFDSMLKVDFLVKKVYLYRYGCLVVFIK